MKELSITIITICKNAQSTLEKAIESVLYQNYKHIQYIVIDGKSSDETPAILEKYSERIAKIISEEDSGIYSAMNKGIRYAEGDYIYFLNSDDFLVDEHVISDVANFITRHPNSDIVYGNLEIRDINDDRQVLASPEPSQILRTLVSGAMHHQATFAHQRVFEEVGVFKEKYKSAGDYEWWIRVASEESLSKAYYDRVIASYFVGGQSSNLTLALQEMFEAQNNAAIYQTNHWLSKRIRIYQEIIKEPQGFWDLVRIKEEPNEIPGLAKLSFFQKIKRKLRSIF
ncbi:glycosyltransferase family 2 protein [Leptothoe kymatousa]|uniref:Glycosyltransferase n=1 Tax=Leptothoe kymatousa TAU-MAC 1615 TaxID=2364775 RepID=A0ABS5Y5A6_9CYAN|nr:glycosyltransferase family 2 protein [Leptothoe kymatousa]MBT9313001.1 glycosyltransferase [Leptothoe kymatousa TAU-MAC 1615]